jgi:hypothetical protein
MTAWRTTVVFSCGALTVGLWAWVAVHPGVPAPWPLWPMLVWGGCGLVTCMMSSEPQGRRWHALVAVLLLLSVWLVQELKILMPEDAWRSAGQPLRPGAAELQHRVIERSQDFLSLRWIVGFSQPSWLSLALGLPLCVIFLMGLSGHAAVPRQGQRLAQLALVLWAVAVLLYAGIGLNDLWPAAPWWFWLLLVVLPPFRFKSTHAEMAMLVWCVALAALVCMLLNAYLPLTLMRDGVVAVAVMVTVCVWLVWLVNCEAIAQFDQDRERNHAAATRTAADFDLQAHLDSPQAQEGADKYTRE